MVGSAVKVQLSHRTVRCIVELQGRFDFWGHARYRAWIWTRAIFNKYSRKGSGLAGGRADSAWRPPASGVRLRTAHAGARPSGCGASRRTPSRDCLLSGGTVGLLPQSPSEERLVL